MVKIGDFTIELVRADTKEAFKEHTGPAPDNHVYAEVEPNVDYFIRAGSSRGGVRVGMTVDGEKLGHYKSWKSPDASKYIGSWERQGGLCKMTALRFNAARVKHEGGMPSMLTGKVEAAFHELGEKKYEEEARDFVTKELTGGSKMVGKKCVESVSGKYVLDRKMKPVNRVSHHKKGKKLCTITLHYCTAVGLIVNKILDAPPEPVCSETLSSTAVKSEKSSTAVKSENTKMRIKFENTKKRNREEDEDQDPIVMLPVETKSRGSVEAEMVDLTGDDED